MNAPLRFVGRVRSGGARALLLGGAGVVCLVLVSAAPASAGEGVASRGAGIGPYVTPASGVILNAGVTGTATVGTKDGMAEVEADVRGLEPGTKHAAHVHLGSCIQVLGHFRYNPAGPGIRSNEVWLDFTANEHGSATDEVMVPAFDLNQTLSIVVHQNANPDVVAGSVPGPRIACGNLVSPGRLSFRVGPYATAATGVIPNAGVTGNATLITRNGTTEVRLSAEGLMPGSKHAAHVHLGNCTDLLGHFRYDPNGPATRSNEVWLDLTANDDGEASARAFVRALDLTKPLSIVIHQNANPDVVIGSSPGQRIACGPAADAESVNQ